MSTNCLDDSRFKVVVGRADRFDLVIAGERMGGFQKLDRRTMIHDPLQGHFEKIGPKATVHFRRTGRSVHPPMSGGFCIGRTHDSCHRFRSGLASGAEKCGERIRNRKAGVTSCCCVISCGVGSDCASGASCAQPCGVLYLVYDWPCVLLWGSMTKQCTKSQTSVPYRLGAKTQILYGKALIAQGLGG